MEGITWKTYMELLAVLATLYYTAIYLLFFKKKPKRGGHTPQDSITEKEQPVTGP